MEAKVLVTCMYVSLLSFLPNVVICVSALGGSVIDGSGEGGGDCEVCSCEGSGVGISFGGDVGVSAGAGCSA